MFDRQIPTAAVTITTFIAFLIASTTFATDRNHAAFSMPTPDGWRTETIPFPLEFAPDLAYEGLEELRFAPGMFETDSDDYWSYAFVWWVPADTEVTAQRLGEDLEGYFRGLTSAVSQSAGFDPGEVFHQAEIQRTTNPKSDRALFEGKVKTYDPFAARAPVTLQLKVEVIPCHQMGHVGLFFELSPQPREHQIWTTLAGIRTGFGCTG